MGLQGCEVRRIWEFLSIGDGGNGRREGGRTGSLNTENKLGS
jgi:hypothetical protein